MANGQIQPGINSDQAIIGGAFGYQNTGAAEVNHYDALARLKSSKPTVNNMTPAGFEPQQNIAANVPFPTNQSLNSGQTTTPSDFFEYNQNTYNPNAVNQVMPQSSFETSQTVQNTPDPWANQNFDAGNFIPLQKPESLNTSISGTGSLNLSNPSFSPESFANIGQTAPNPFQYQNQVNTPKSFDKPVLSPYDTQPMPAGFQPVGAVLRSNVQNGAQTATNPTQASASVAKDTAPKQVELITVEQALKTSKTAVDLQASLFKIKKNRVSN